MKIQIILPEIPLETKQLISYALSLIADRCNGARTRDGEGFNRDDAEFGLEMADKNFEEWSYLETREIWLILRKYERQLQEEGLSWKDLPPIS